MDQTEDLGPPLPENGPIRHQGWDFSLHKLPSEAGAVLSSSAQDRAFLLELYRVSGLAAPGQSGPEPRGLEPSRVQLSRQAGAKLPHRAPHSPAVPRPRCIAVKLFVLNQLSSSTVPQTEDSC